MRARGQVEVELPTTATTMLIGPMQCQFISFRSKSSELARECDCGEATMWRCCSGPHHFGRILNGPSDPDREPRIGAMAPKYLSPTFKWDPSSGRLFSPRELRMGPAAIFRRTRLRPCRGGDGARRSGVVGGMGDVAAPSEKRMSGASIALPAAFQRANFGLASSTLSPAAVASRVGTDDDFRISRVIENPEVLRRF
jgi:hypothetical protein